MTSVTAPAPRPSSNRRMGRRIRGAAGTGFVYLLLFAIGVIVVFPFLFMLTSAFKTGEEVYRYPPKLLPYEQATITVPGATEPTPLYEIEVAPGDTRAMAAVETGVKAGLFVTAADPTGEPVPWPVAEAVPATNPDGSVKTVLLDGTPLEVFNVPVLGVPGEYAKTRDTAVAKFVDPNDSTVVGYAVLRTATPVESPTAHPENFNAVLERAGFDRSLSNTLLVTLAVVFGQLFTSILGGYAFARIRFPGRDAVFLIYLGSIMVPFVVLIIPLYQLMVAIGWVDRVPSLIFPWLFSAYGTFLMRQFFITIPRELEEAAFVDGASRWTILWRLFVPLSLPAVATQITFSFLYAWNSFVWPFIVISTGNTDAQVLSVALLQFGGRAQDAPQLIFAGVTIAVAVPILAFALVQRYFVENVATSGIK
ncbi:MAG TPA: carbohydrate ABC transporter permease [Candidatus Limnocylindrales bacterium]|nr:carbohydrate ABC transporter permease [Candidatus Limnocylindrales bacterium]